MSFKIGDVVKLKSGGPEMTVIGISTGPNRSDVFNCSWIDPDHHEQKGTFPAEALVLANAEKPQTRISPPPTARSAWGA
jgi:uncharacterized protein YodC (DUF2158 family)